MLNYWRSFDQKTQRLFLTIAASSSATAAKFIITLISIPLIIGYLGSQMYGLVSTVLTMCIWVNTIADGGIGLSLKNAIIKKRAQGNIQDIASLSSSAFFIMLIIITALCLLLSFIIPFLNWSSILNLQVKIAPSQLVGFIIILLWSTLLIIPFSLPKLIYAAYQQEYLFSIWLFLGSILGLAILLIVIKLQQSIVLVGSALQIGTLIGAILGSLWFVHKKTDIKFSMKGIKLSTFKELLSPSLDFFLLQFTALAIFQSGVFITNFLLGQQSAAVYSLHFQVFAYFQLFITLIVSPFWSVISEAYHQNNYLYLKNILLKLVFAVFLLTLLFSITALCFGQSIITLLSHGQINFDFKLMFLLAVYHLLSITIGVISLTLLSIGDTRLMSKVVIIQSILTITLSIFFVKTYGIIGCALGSLISIILTIMWYSPLRMRTSYIKWSKPHEHH